MFCLFLNGAQASAKSKLWRYFLRQTFYTGEGVIPETSDNFTLKFGTRNIHFLVRVPRSKNLFCNILARSGFRDFALFLVFWKMFLFFLEVFRVFWRVFLVFWGVLRVFWVFRDVPMFLELLHAGKLSKYCI